MTDVMQRKVIQNQRFNSLFLPPCPNCFKSFFLSDNPENLHLLTRKWERWNQLKNYSHFLPPWRLRRGSKESLSLPPCIQSPDVWLGRYTIMGLSSSHNDNFWKINTSSSHVSYGINYCVSEKCLRTKHCQRHNGPKTLSRYFTHLPPLDQSRWFNKLWNLCQPSFVWQTARKA